MHRRPTPAEDYRKAHLNPQVMSQKSLIKPLNQGIKESVEPLSKSRPECAPYPIDPKELFEKLEMLKRKQEKEKQEKEKEQQRELGKNNFIQELSSKLQSAQPRTTATAAAAQPGVQDKEIIARSIINMLNSGLPRDDVDVQSILDHHVSSVFSPRHTPGSTSPKNLQRSHHRSNEMSSSVPDFGKIKRQTLICFSFTVFT